MEQLCIVFFDSYDGLVACLRERELRDDGAEYAETFAIRMKRSWKALSSTAAINRNAA